MGIYPWLAISLSESIWFSISAVRHGPLRQFANSCTFHSGMLYLRIMRYLVLIFFHCFQYTALILRLIQPSMSLSMPFISANLKYWSQPFMNCIYRFDWHTMKESECVAELMIMYQSLVEQQ